MGRWSRPEGVLDTIYQSTARSGTLVEAQSAPARKNAATGFIVAFPLATLLALHLSPIQHGDSENTILHAKSIFVAVPVTLAFFIPLPVSGKFGLSFWQAYPLGGLARVLANFAHRAIMGILWRPGT